MEAFFHELYLASHHALHLMENWSYYKRTLDEKKKSERDIKGDNKLIANGAKVLFAQVHWN